MALDLQEEISQRLFALIETQEKSTETLNNFVKAILELIAKKQPQPINKFEVPPPVIPAAQIIERKLDYGLRIVRGPDGKASHIVPCTLESVPTL